MYSGPLRAEYCIVAVHTILLSSYRLINIIQYQLSNYLGKPWFLEDFVFLKINVHVPAIKYVCLAFEIRVST